MRRVAMRHGPEFERIEAFLDAVGAELPREAALGPGDDAAVLGLAPGEKLVVSTDLSIEEVHFRREWLTWRAIGHRAAAAALSDLAAMAARPLGALTSVAVPPELDTTVLLEIGGGIGDCLRRHDAGLLGGDLSRSPGPAIIDVVVLGASPSPVGRSGAIPGDELWVTGRLGGAGAAAMAWTTGLEPDPAARERFERPRPRTGEMQWLASQVDIHAAIDLSDGLAADVAHLCAASSVAAEIQLDTLPLHASLEGWANAEVALGLACGGGEDYEVLLALPPDQPHGIATTLEAEHGVELTRIGRIVDGAGVRWIGSDGGLRESPAAGFDHFDAGV